MKIIIIILILSLFGFKSERNGCLKADIILLADMSGSIKGHEQYVYNALLTFVNRFELSEEGIRMSLVTFNWTEEVLYPLGSDKNALLDALVYMISKPPEGGTDMYKAFTAAKSEFIKRGIHQNRIVIVISDSSPSYPIETQEMAKELKIIFNSLVFGVLVNSYDRNDTFMKDISSPNCYLETEFETLGSELQKLDVCL